MTGGRCKGLVERFLMHSVKQPLPIPVDLQVEKVYSTRRALSGEPDVRVHSMQAVPKQSLGSGLAQVLHDQDVIKESHVQYGGGTPLIRRASRLAKNKLATGGARGVPMARPLF